MAVNVKERDETEYTWDLTPIYKDQDSWEKDFGKMEDRLNGILDFKGKLGESAENLKRCLEMEDEFDRLVKKLYVYAHLKNDEDLTNSFFQGLYDRISSANHQLSAKLAWIQPEIMAIDDKTMEEFLSSKELAFYSFAIKQMLRYKPHTLSNGEETIMALAGEVLGVPHKAFSSLTNADMKFPKVKNEAGEEEEMTHSLYSKYLESYDRKVREQAFHGMYSTFNGVINTTAALLDGAIRQDIFKAKVRKYPSALEASLFNDNVNKEVYTRLIETVNNNLPAFHEYVAFRKKALKLDKIDMFDMYVPLVENFAQEINWDTAVKWVMASLKPLGEEYCEIAEKAFKERWIDVLESKGKRSGAYSSGCYDSFPYILMNYNNTLNSVFTLAHELGHSMHSYLSRESQEYRYSSYPIILAEVASITNEMLLLDYLLKETTDDKMKKYLLNYFCDSAKGTLFRQTQFAEFEMITHEKVEKGEPLTVDELNKVYYDINKRYYGPEVKPHEEIKYEWARIPHFYYNFYVYKYATGFAAANMISAGLLSREKGRKDSYLKFLNAGSSDEPLNTLKKAGVDLASPEPVETGINRFRETVRELMGMF